MLYILFFYSLSLSLILPFFPYISHLHLFYFAPFLVIVLYRCPLPTALWWALGCGLWIDLFASQTRLGFYSLAYCLTTLCFYRTHRYFFEDRLITLPFMTMGLSSLLTAIQAVLFFWTTDSSSFFSWQWIKNDLIGMPLQDALYACCAFTLPLSLRYYFLSPSYVFRRRYL